MEANMNAISNTTPTTTTEETKKRKRSQGRQRIEIKKLEDESRRQVTFSKRRKGLFKKAKELSTLCGVEIGALTVSKSGKVYTTENVDEVLNLYLMLNQQEDEIDDLQEINGGFGLDLKVENLNLVELMEYGKDLEELRRKAAARLEELSIQNSISLWPWVVDEKVNTANQFMVEGKLGFGS